MQIGLLGTLAVQDEAGRPVRVGGYRVRMLLILLALDAGRVVPAHSLIERLWDGDPPGNSANSLQALVSRLRTALRQADMRADLIESHPAGYRLAVPPGAVDAVVFDALAREGSQALASGDAVTARRALRQALGAWRGPALADASGARFAAGPAARLEESRARAALDLIEAGLALGESDSLIGDLRAMIAADPVAERPRGLLMRALYAAGRQAEAVAVYAEARELLADELGVDPSPQLEQIYLGVLRQDLQGPRDGGPAEELSIDIERSAPGEADSRRLTAVRKPLTSFVGRDDDVARVLKMLTDGRLVTLTGPGGAGKTRLAIETATRLAADSPTGTAGTASGPKPAPALGGQVWLVELTPVSDPGEVPFAVLNALGIRESPVLAHAGPGRLGGLADPAQRLVATLAERRDLLILDNCEHVVAAAAALADQVLAGCPGVRMLVTSREPLRITGEALWPVPPLPVPPAPAEGPDPEAPDQNMIMNDADPGEPADDGSQVAGYASVRLLADRAAAVRPDFTVNADNAADVARICRALDGMPLAIELAAARLRTLSAAQLAQRLDARFELLTGGSRTAVPRHQTLRAVVDWSWELLSEPEQVLARRLATFSGGATLAAAEQVCQDAALPAEAILPAIFGLVEKSFLAVTGDGEPRYRMLETIRAYCLERLADAGEEDWARRAFASYFVRLAETADPLLRGAQQRTWMRRLTAEQDNIHAALHWALERRDAGLALRFGQALGWFWLLRGQRRESGTMSREILAISEPEGRGAGWTEERGARDERRGKAVPQGAPRRRAQEHSEPEGLQTAPRRRGQEHSEPEGRGSAWTEERATKEGGASKAPRRRTGKHSEPAIWGDRDPGVLHARAVCALTVLNAFWDIAEVSQPLADAGPLMRPEPADGGGGPDDLPPHPLVVVGAAMLALWEKRDPDQALKVSVAHFDSADPWTRSGSRLMHALMSLAMGRLDHVADGCAEALAGFEAIGDRWGMALALVGQAELSALDGDHARAIAVLERATELSRELTDWEDTAQMYASLAKSRSRLGDYRGALADMARAQRAAREQGESESDLWITYVRAELEWLRGDLAEAGRIARRLDARMASKNTPMIWSFQAQARNRSALADIRAGRAAEGRAALADALRLAGSSLDRSAVAIVVDGIAAAALWADGSRAGAERAAVLLGAAHSIRGAFDHSSLDAPQARDTARQTLGGQAFEHAYRRGRELGYDEALALAEETTRISPKR